MVNDGLVMINRETLLGKLGDGLYAERMVNEE